jgi:hypothetical protein
MTNPGLFRGSSRPQLSNATACQGIIGKTHPRIACSAASRLKSAAIPTLAAIDPSQKNNRRQGAGYFAMRPMCRLTSVFVSTK